MAKTVECARKGCKREFKVGFVGCLVGHRKHCKICRVGLLEPGIRVKGGVGEVRFGPFGKPDHRTLTNAMLGIRPQGESARRRAAARHGLANNSNFELREDDFDEPDLTVSIDPTSGTAEVNFGAFDTHRGRTARADLAAERGLGTGASLYYTEPLDGDFDGTVLDGEVLNTAYL